MHHPSPAERDRLDDRPPQLPGSVKLLGVASLLNDVASEMTYPLLPQFLIGTLGGNRLHLGIIEGVTDSLASLLKLWSGSRSDRLRQRKWWVIWGYFVAAMSRPLVGLCTAPWQLFVIRMIDRTGKGVRTSPRDALIADATSSTLRGRAFGFHRSMDHLGAALGPILAFLFLAVFPGELRTLFLLTSLPGLCVVITLLALLRESPTNTEVSRSESASGSVRLQGGYYWYLASVVLFTLGNSSDAFLLVRAEELGVPTSQLPLLWCLFHVVKSAGNLWFGPIADRLGARPLIACGWILYALIYLGFAGATSAWHAWGLFLGFGLFYALSEPAERKLVAAWGGQQSQGAAFGRFHAAIGIATLPASVCFGALYQTWGPFAAFGCGAALALGATALLLTSPLPSSAER